MSLVISSSYVLADSTSGGGTITADNPVVGYDNIVASGTLDTTTQDASYPRANLLNPATHLRWKGTSIVADEYLTVLNPNVQDLDYIAIARHNLFTAQIPVSVEYLTLPSTWTELIAPVILPNDGPALFRFPRLAYSGIRLRFQHNAVVPTVAVAYCGQLLVLQRRFYVGHTPINLGRAVDHATHRSVAGNFLGRIVLGTKTGTAVALRNLTPDWYRTYMVPFTRAAEEIPFFFAWRPSTYPNEVGYAWLTQDAKPSNSRQNGMMQLDLQLEGIV